MDTSSPRMLKPSAPMAARNNFNASLEAVDELVPSCDAEGPVESRATILIAQHGRSFPPTLSFFATTHLVLMTRCFGSMVHTMSPTE